MVFNLEVPVKRDVKVHFGHTVIVNVRRLDKKIDINYYLKSVVGLCARFINYDDRYQPSSEIVLKALKKLKDGNADDDEDDMDEDEVDEDEMDEDAVSKLRDALAQKSAEKWIRGYIKAYMMIRKKIKPSYLIYSKGHAFP